MARKLAIITGASTGIGFELAHIAAQDGYDLIVVANEDLIEASAADFRTHGNEVTAVNADLATEDGVETLLEHVAGRPVAVLCANAGRAQHGDFLSQKAIEWRRTIDTNITGTLYLLQRVMRDMVARGEGKVLVTGSIAGFIPGPGNSVYNATKAFVDNFCEALIHEIKDHAGITLTNLLPGATETEFFERGGFGDTKVGQADKDDAAKVAKDGWDAMLKGENRIVSGFYNKAQVAAAGIVPQSTLAGQHADMMEPAKD